MATLSVEITGLSEELLRRLDERVEEARLSDRAEYVLQLLENDLLSAGSVGAPRLRGWRGILAPVHDETPAGESEAESEAFVQELIHRARRERRKEREQDPAVDLA